MMLIKKIKTTVVALSLSLISLTSFAQQKLLQEESATVKLSLEACRQMAIENNLENNIANEKVKLADYQVAAYKSNYLPKLSATGMYLYNDATLGRTITGGDIYNLIPDAVAGLIPEEGLAFLPDIPLELQLNKTYNASLVIEQPIYTGGKIKTAHEMAEKGREMAQANVKLSKIEVIVHTDEAYWNVVKVKSLIESAIQYKETLQELHRMVQNAVEVGMTHRKDLLSVQVKLNEAELNLARAKNGHKLAVMNLNHVIGLPLHTNTDVADSFEDETEIALIPESLDSFDAIDITSRPEYDLFTKQVELKEREVNLVRSDFLPRVGVMGAYGYTNGLHFNGRSLIDDTSLSALLSISIPIFNWGEGRNKINEAKLHTSIAQMQLEDTEQKMMLEATKALNELNEAQLEVMLTSKSVEQAEENMRLSKDRYTAGMETLADYMEAQTMWQNASSTHIAAKASLYLYKTKYLKATGQL